MLKKHTVHSLPGPQKAEKQQFGFKQKLEVLIFSFPEASETSRRLGACMASPSHKRASKCIWSTALVTTRDRLHGSIGLGLTLGSNNGSHIHRQRDFCPVLWALYNSGSIFCCKFPFKGANIALLSSAVEPLKEIACGSSLDFHFLLFSFYCIHIHFFHSVPLCFYKLGSWEIFQYFHFVCGKINDVLASTLCWGLQGIKTMHKTPFSGSHHRPNIRYKRIIDTTHWITSDFTITAIIMS